MRESWESYWLRQCNEVASRSRDPSTKVGCVFIDSRNRRLSDGYNGFAVGVADTKERYENRDIKLRLTAHAEANGIANAANIGVALRDAMLVVNVFPCSGCMKLIINVGVKNILIDYINNHPEFYARWKEDLSYSWLMSREARVNILEGSFEKNAYMKLRETLEELTI